MVLLNINPLLPRVTIAPWLRYKYFQNIIKYQSINKRSLDLLKVGFTQFVLPRRDPQMLRSHSNQAHNNTFCFENEKTKWYRDTWCSQNCCKMTRWCGEREQAAIYVWYSELWKQAWLRGKTCHIYARDEWWCFVASIHPRRWCDEVLWFYSSLKKDAKQSPWHLVGRIPWKPGLQQMGLIFCS